ELRARRLFLRAFRARLRRLGRCFGGFCRWRGGRLAAAPAGPPTPAALAHRRRGSGRLGLPRDFCPHGRFRGFHKFTERPLLDLWRRRRLGQLHQGHFLGRRQFLGESRFLVHRTPFLAAPPALPVPAAAPTAVAPAAVVPAPAATFAAPVIAPSSELPIL